jgi:hypothetical protein
VLRAIQLWNQSRSTFISRLANLGSRNEKRLQSREGARNHTGQHHERPDHFLKDEEISRKPTSWRPLEF